MRRIVMLFIAVLFLAPFVIPSLRHFWPGRQKEKMEGLPVKYAKEEKEADIHDEVLNYRLRSKKRIRQIQMALQKAGYYKGEIDGKLGVRTKRAVKGFQKAKKLNPDGIAGEKTWEALKQYLED